MRDFIDMVAAFVARMRSNECLDSRGAAIAALDEFEARFGERVASYEAVAAAGEPAAVPSVPAAVDQVGPIFPGVGFMSPTLVPNDEAGGLGFDENEHASDSEHQSE